MWNGISRPTSPSVCSLIWYSAISRLPCNAEVLNSPASIALRSWFFCRRTRLSVSSSGATLTGVPASRSAVSDRIAVSNVVLPTRAGPTTPTLNGSLIPPYPVRVRRRVAQRLPEPRQCAPQALDAGGGGPGRVLAPELVAERLGGKRNSASEVAERMMVSSTCSP